jgi:hypothetical protein
MSLIKYTNHNLKKIVCVYQLNYINGRSSGLGDYLRGSFTFMQLSKLFNLEFDIDISNHPMSKYIENANKSTEVIYDNVMCYYDMNRKNGLNNYENIPVNINFDFLNNLIIWLNSQNCETVYLFSNAFPCFNNYTPEGADFMRLRLQPNEFMRNYVDETLTQMNLTKTAYGVIHIRTGDKYLIDKENSNLVFFNKILNLLYKLIDSNKKYLIISDSNCLKFFFKNIPNFYCIIKNIEHLGGEYINTNNDEGIMNTMLDFFLMSHSNAILSLSVYDHISGFSKYCSVIHNIPFQYIQISE